MSVYLGPSGNLLTLRSYDRGHQPVPERLGGTHQLLSGARVRDTLAVKQTFQVGWSWLSDAEYLPLEGLFLGVYGDGPFYWMDQGRKNFCDLNVSTGTDYLDTTSGFTPVTTTGLFSDVNAGWNNVGGPFPVGGTRRLGAGVANGTAAFTGIYNPTTSIPVTPGVTYTASAYLSPPGAFGVYLQLRYLDVSGTLIAGGEGVGFKSGNALVTPDRSIATLVAPAGAVTAQMRVNTAAANSSGSTGFVYADGFQFEIGSAATPWQLGNGVPRVLIDSVSPTININGWRDVTATLIEV